MSTIHDGNRPNFSHQGVVPPSAGPEGGRTIAQLEALLGVEATHDDATADTVEKSGRPGSTGKNSLPPPGPPPYRWDAATRQGAHSFANNIEALGVADAGDAAAAGNQSGALSQLIDRMSTDQLIAAFLKLNIMDPNNSPETHNQLYEALSGHRKAALKHESEKSKEAEEKMMEALQKAEQLKILSMIITVIMIVVAIAVAAVTMGPTAALVVAGVAALAAALGAAVAAGKGEDPLEGALNAASIGAAVAGVACGIGALVHTAVQAAKEAARQAAEQGIRESIKAFVKTFVKTLKEQMQRTMQQAAKKVGLGAQKTAQQGANQAATQATNQAGQQATNHATNAAKQAAQQATKLDRYQRGANVLLTGTMMTGEGSKAIVQYQVAQEQAAAAEASNKAKMWAKKAEESQDQLKEEAEIMHMLMESKNRMVDSVIKMFAASHTSAVKLMLASRR